MIIRCDNCSGALKYDVATGKMKCEYCGGLYDTQDVEGEVYQEETMECSVLTCTACGAELMVNKVEAATYCAYCGQPTIVFSRVSKMLKPDKIIPFSITKEKAINLLEAKLRKGAFVPVEVKSFSKEQVCGLYIPYWIHDITYRDRQLLRDTSIGRRCDYVVEVEGSFKNILKDASFKLWNDISKRIEPFDLSGLKDFEEDYLSGFYADRYDVDKSVARRYAKAQCKKDVDQKIKSEIMNKDADIVSSEPRITIDREEYIMVPVWFVTAQYKDSTYTLLVNGQNGKIVGAVPFSKSLIIGKCVVRFFVYAVILRFLGMFIYNFSKGNDDLFWFLLLAFFCVIYTEIQALPDSVKRIKKVKEDVGFMSSGEIITFTKYRQKGD